jgi:zinc D-Ala-D-Ala dipeptidase
MKPYQQVSILECGESLVPIPLDRFAVQCPHPYERLAAPYETKSPYFLRSGVLKQLLMAQTQLQQQYRGWKIQIFDAYRPIAVQRFMVNYTFEEIVRSHGLLIDQLTDAQRQAILEQVYQFWAMPSDDPATPPPHSTGAAVDVTLVNAEGVEIDMGSPIDELSVRSYPDYFAENSNWLSPEAAAAMSHQYRSSVNHNRNILRSVMIEAGFRQHPQEWWHFSLGDQMWAWLSNHDNAEQQQIARYGAI